MDGRRFDELTRAFGSPGNRRGFLKGILGAGLAAAGLGRLARTDASAQVSQAQCGNTSCRNNPAKCAAGCVCCAYGNGNTRCTPPGSCSGTPTCPPGKVADPVLGCVDCLTAANCPGPIDGNPCLAAACIAGKCGIQPGNIGATCGQTTCSSGAVTSYACSSDGTCAPSSTTSCHPYTCAGDEISCRTNCTDDMHCVGNSYCSNGTCVGDLPQGVACTRNEQCATGYCTDGVCCEVESCGECHTCAVGPNPGTCFALLGMPCPSEPCNQGVCMGGRCTQQPTGDNLECGQSGECFRMVCFGGTCVEQSANETESCGDGGTDCNPKKCVGGLCQSVPETGGSCANGNGLCFEGDCCIGGTVDGICAIGEFGTCCETERCCGFSCCNDCFLEPSTSGVEDRQICCSQNGTLCPPNDPNASRCCYSNEHCLATPTGGHQCVDSERDCGGTICDGDCCGTDCCEDGQYCNGTACVAVPSGDCFSDSECGANLRCVGITETLEFEGEGEPTLVTGPGFCCPANRACRTRLIPEPDGQPNDTCVPYGLRCGSEIGQTCTNAYYVACNGCDTGCSPRGSRTRL